MIYCGRVQGELQRLRQQAAQQEAARQAQARAAAVQAAAMAPQPSTTQELRTLKVSWDPQVRLLPWTGSSLTPACIKLEEHLLSA